jgi:hypothetical protein
MRFAARLSGLASGLALKVAAAILGPHDDGVRAHQIHLASPSTPLQPFAKISNFGAYLPQRTADSGIGPRTAAHPDGKQDHESHAFAQVKGANLRLR